MNLNTALQQGVAVRMGEVVVITGASAGLGRATALRFGREGARVALIARNPEALEEAASEVRGAGGTALAIPLDVSDADALDRAADRIELELGPIDVWVNCALASVFGPAAEITPEEYRRVTEISYLGQVYGTLSALRRMRARGRGHIVLVGSGLAYRGVPFHSAYCGVKFGLRGFFESVRTELAHERSSIQIAMVHPSSLDTPFYSWVRVKGTREPMAVKPVYAPEVAADAIYYASHRPCRELRVGASATAAAWLNGLFPSVTDRLLGRVGWRVEQRDSSPAPDRPENLGGIPTARYTTGGEFGRVARGSSVTTWTAENRRWVAAGTLVMAAAAVLIHRRKH